MKKLYALGIDFGTSNSCVCQACYIRNDDGTLDPQPLKPPEPITIQYRDTAPTAVFIGTATEAPAYGEIAEEKSVFYPELTKTNFKMRLGAAGQDGVDALQYTTDFLRFLRAQLENVIPFDASPDEAEIATCIGHPVQWTAEQRRLTRQAAVDAGFPSVTIEDETSAAIYGLLCESQLIMDPERDTRIMVVDMGGGTTDFAFVELSHKLDVAPITTPVDPSRLVESWDGVRQTYGGRDIDELLLNHIAGPWGYTPQHREWAFLLRETRRFKEQFSLSVARGMQSYRASWMLEKAPEEVQLTREEFEEVAKNYIRHLGLLMEAALKLEKLKPEQVDAVVLTGGSSRWYWVGDIVQKVFPHISREAGTLVRHRNPDQSVARGLPYRWTIDSLGGRPRPRRRSTHAIWIASPESTSRGHGTEADARDGDAALTDDPLLVMDRGHILPFRTSAPAKLVVQKMDFDSGQATVRLKLYTGSDTAARQELLDQITTFKRPFMESLLKKVARIIPWSTSLDTDQFDVEVQCAIDENELIAGRFVITRYYRGKPAQQQVQMLEMEAESLT